MGRILSALAECQVIWTELSYPACINPLFRTSVKLQSNEKCAGQRVVLKMKQTFLVPWSCMLNSFSHLYEHLLAKYHKLIYALCFVLSAKSLSLSCFDIRSITSANDSRKTIELYTFILKNGRLYIKMLGRWLDLSTKCWL